MNAIVLYQTGAAENLNLVDKPLPVVKLGHVLIKVKAFGLNRSELMTRKGLSPDVLLPRVLGIECVGEVEDDPSGHLRKGQQVAAFMGGMGRDFDGSYATYAVLPLSIIIPFESKLPWELLGALPEMFQTAYGSLHYALKIQKGETLLILGGTSSVGLLAAQLARAYGLHVVSTTRNPDKEKFLLDHGADLVLIDDGNLAMKVKGKGLPEIDKVLELVGAGTLKDSLQCVKLGGTVCMTGMLSEQWSIPDFAPMEFIPATVNLTIYDSGQFRVDGQHFQTFVNDIEKGLIAPVIKRVFQFEEIVDAHVFMESNTGGGKIVVLV
ncbi:zinc-binding alcohol dehydrogenase family protein [Sphingobacterium faecium]|uniref:zinc-binding alcohol dehydrogenase family protein n=1 Tax=Sphingobacterium faecium TaxID=34087 RepID=UPI0032087BE5